MTKLAASSYWKSPWGNFSWCGLIIASMMVLTSCAPAQPKLEAGRSTAITPQNEPGLAPGHGADAAAVAACNAQGGVLQPVCMMGKVSCVIKYADADKACTDGSQCQSKRCLAQWSATNDPKQAMQGVCKATNNPCGCFTFLENGKPGYGICVD